MGKEADLVIRSEAAGIAETYIAENYRYTMPVSLSSTVPTYTFYTGDDSLSTFGFWAARSDNPEDRVHKKLLYKLKCL